MDAQFHSALHALFGHDAAAQHEANAWLIAFSPRPEAWQAAVALLEPDSPAQASFFCANMLLSKARLEWSTMPQEQRDHISQLAR